MLGFILKFMQVRIDAGYDSDAYPHSFCRTAAKTVDLLSMIRTTLALTLPLSLASILALAACETESSQRPGTTKTGSGKKSSGKANAEWSSADLIPGDEMVIEVEVDGDDDGNAPASYRFILKEVTLKASHLRPSSCPLEGVTLKAAQLFPKKCDGKGDKGGASAPADNKK